MTIIYDITKALLRIFQYCYGVKILIISTRERSLLTMLRLHNTLLFVHLCCFTLARADGAAVGAENKVSEPLII
jgi:hypothetical protein